MHTIPMRCEAHDKLGCCEYAAEPRYLVRCDECKATIRRTDLVAESAAGGHCDACNERLDVEYPARAALRAQVTS